MNGIIKILLIAIIYTVIYFVFERSLDKGGMFSAGVLTGYLIFILLEVL